ncbi:flagellin [Selenomonas sp. GACV-9]|uniref:flagellin n=1 Tax=Selenomonas sp. GACV-9 TaxID=3158782 RepID=UPI0008F445F2|nr:flagellin [Selenomonas ruminantium]
MTMVVKNNMPAKNTLNQLDKNDKALAKSLKKVASGMKVNSAADDASGYAISEKMRVQINGLEQDDANTQNGKSLLTVAQGAIDSTVEILKTLKEKAISAANDTNTDSDRANIQKELDQSIDQLTDNANVTFNGKTLLDGSKNNSVIEGGTYTHLTNQSLSPETTGDTSILELVTRNNESLGIQSSDTLTISWVQNGETHTKTINPLAYFERELNPNFYSGSGLPRYIDVKKGYTLKKILEETEGRIQLASVDANIGANQFGNTVKTADGQNAITIKSSTPGVAGQIAGFTIGITDKDGNQRKFANNALDAFDESIRAQNESEDNALVFQIGTKANQAVKVGMTDMRPAALGLTSTDTPVKTLSVSNQDDANAAINVLDHAVQKALDQQTQLGAIASRMDYTAANLTTARENTQASESVIRDANMAQEMTAYTKNNILTQSAQAMLAQANQNSSQVLSLLQ